MTNRFCLKTQSFLLKAWILTCLASSIYCYSNAQSFYTMIPNKDVNSSVDDQSLVANFDDFNRLRCLGKCSDVNDCLYVRIGSSSCKLYKILDAANFVDSSDTSILIYQKNTNTNTFTNLNVDDLQHYWPILENDLADYKGQADMFNCSNTTFVADHRGEANTALYMNNGYCQVRPDVYFDGGNFAVTGWAKLISQTDAWTPFIDFGSGMGQDNFYISLTYNSSLFPSTAIYKPGSGAQGFRAVSNRSINLGQWYHYSVTFNGFLNLYLNGSCVASLRVTGAPRNITRTSCFFGKSNWGFANINAYINNVKIYGRALNLNEILADMNQ